MTNLPENIDVKIPAQEHVQEEKPKANFFNKSPALVNGVTLLYSVLESQSHQLRTAWLTLLAVTIFCVWVISFTYTVLISDNPIPQAYNFSPSHTIFLVGLASHITVLLTSLLIGSVFDALSWAVISGANGASLRTFIVTSKDTGIFDVVKHLLTRGPHQKWSILRFSVVAIGWVIGPLLLGQLRTEDFYQTQPTFDVVAGIALFNESVAALEKSNAIGTTSTLQDTTINDIILGSSRSILNDPGFAVPLAPVVCSGPGCKSIFLPGGLELVRFPNGSAISSVPYIEPVLIVNDASGIQVEFSTSNYTFNRTTDCTLFGLPFSSLYSCIAFVDNTIQSAITVCPLANVDAFTCHSNTTWYSTFDAAVALTLYQRTATVSYDRSNFSIIDVVSLSEPVNVVNQDLLADFQNIFEIMYPKIIDIDSVVSTILGGETSILNDIYYWASVYCVQSELVSAQDFYHQGFPTWITSERDILEGFLTLPIQFSTLLWQWNEVHDLGVLPGPLHVTAAGATVSKRVRSNIWTIATFAALILALIVWSIFSLMYARIIHSIKKQEDHDPAIEAAFQRGNPFDVDDSIWKLLWGTLTWTFCCGRKLKNEEEVEKEVVAKTLGEKDMLIAVDLAHTQSSDSTQEENRVAS